MTDKPSREDVLRVAGEPVATVISVPPFHLSVHFSYAGVCVPGQKLYTEAQLLAMYAAGAEDMRERAAREGWTFLALAGDADSGDNLRNSIRALPITTNTEGEQG